MKQENFQEGEGHTEKPSLTEHLKVNIKLMIDRLLFGKENNSGESEETGSRPAGQLQLWSCSVLSSLQEVIKPRDVRLVSFPECQSMSPLLPKTATDTHLELPSVPLVNGYFTAALFYCLEQTHFWVGYRPVAVSETVSCC